MLKNLIIYLNHLSLNDDVVLLHLIFMKPDISVIYVYYNTPRELLNSVKSLLKTTVGILMEIIIVDNHSTKEIPSQIKKLQGVKIISNTENVGFGKGCNIGAKEARGKYLLFLNPDTKVYPEAVVELLKTIKRKGVGIAGPKMVDKKGNTLPTISRFLSFPDLLVVYSFLNTLLKKNSISKKFWLYDTDRETVQTVDVLSGACLIIARNIFFKVGGFDERFFMYFEEHDLCLKVNNLGLKSVFNPKSIILHLIGKSLKDKSKIRRYFEKSRFIYMKKHFGYTKAIFSEFVLRFMTTSNLFILLLFIISLLINIYRQNELMLFIGDAARDFIAARDMILTHSIPLVGIPSSVPWLHQGPLSVYAIGFSFLLSNFNPISPGIFFGFVGAITTVLFFYLTKEYFGEKAAVIASVLYVSSPMIVVNARMPYHTSLIPFFAVVFFTILLKSLRRTRYLPLVFFALGLLLQVELSNIVVILIIGILFWNFRIKISKKIWVASILSFCVGILPFILYEFQNGPAYLKFPLWIANRVRLFFGLTFHHASTTSALPGALTTIYQQVSGVIFPHVHIVGLFIFSLAFLFIIFGKKRIAKNRELLVLLLWIAIPLIAFLLHAAPGTAYFGLVYPAVILVVALFFERLINNSRFFLFVLMIVVIFNVSILFTNDFFVTNQSGLHSMPPTSYFFGPSIVLSDEVSKAIVADAAGEQLAIYGKGTVALYKTSIDPYIFLVWYHGGRISRESSLQYDIYPPETAALNGKNIVYRGKGGVVVKNE